MKRILIFVVSSIFFVSCTKSNNVSVNNKEDVVLASKNYLLEGDKYFYGRGVEKNYIEARKNYEKAASRNNIEAIYNLGNIYQFGLGVNKDLGKAYDYLNVAANRNYPPAINDLGLMYYKGDGISKNVDKAEALFLKGAELKYVLSYYNLGELYYSDSVKNNDEKAFYYYKLAADSGDSVSMNNVAYLYEHGEGVELSSKNAIIYYEMAFNHGYKSAALNLSNLYNKGNKDMQPSMDKAAFWKEKALN